VSGGSCCLTLVTSLPFQASRVYLARRYKAQPNYRSAIFKYFDTEIESISFDRNEEAADKINLFVRGATKNFIYWFADPSMFNDDTILTVVNAVFFRAAWRYQFDKRFTFNSTFYLDSLNKIKVTYMTTTNDFKIGAVAGLGGATVIELPYANSSLTMTIVLPKTRTGLASLINTAKDFDWRTISGFLVQDTVEVTIPKFSSEFKSNLNGILQKVRYLT
jgi:serine protease inhibitor